MYIVFQLTSENEETIMRLTEQAKVLKDEIRRLERNQERENAISNMEYLKNIVYKVRLLSAFYMSLSQDIFIDCKEPVDNTISCFAVFNPKRWPRERNANPCTDHHVEIQSRREVNFANYCR